MNQQYLVTSVRSTSSGIIGRSLNAIRNHHIVIDSPTIGEAVTSGEAFLAGISSCGVNLIEGVARDEGVPLSRTEVEIEGLRHPDAPSDFAQVNMRFTLHGVNQEQAQFLVQRYKDR
jgi:uncharacterized OsmC-like protein